MQITLALGGNSKRNFVDDFRGSDRLDWRADLFRCVDRRYLLSRPPRSRHSMTVNAGLIFSPNLVFIGLAPTFTIGTMRLPRRPRMYLTWSTQMFDSDPMAGCAVDEREHFASSGVQQVDGGLHLPRRTRLAIKAGFPL